MKFKKCLKVITKAEGLILFTTNFNGTDVNTENFFPDGSDHRHCCTNSAVPRDCLDWCRGLPSKGPSEVCALDHAKTIAQCFHEGQYLLPGKKIFKRRLFSELHEKFEFLNDMFKKL